MRDATMNRKVIIVKALEAIAMPLCVFLVIPSCPSISIENYYRIRLGMTKAEVYAVLPLDLEGWKGGLITERASEVFEEGDCFRLNSIEERWRTDTAYIFVYYNIKGNVVGKRVLPWHEVNTSVLDRLADWLRL
jgi:hypothetical protein